jgi:hypothetical protein
LITNTEISGNESSLNTIFGFSGGGIFVEMGGFLQMQNCILGNNLSHSSGGGISSNGRAELWNCLIHDNTALGGSGGGVYSSLGLNPAITYLTNCTLPGNHAPKGSAIACRSSVYFLTNSILWDTDSVPASSLIYLYKTSYIPKLEVQYSDIQGGQANIEIDTVANIIWDQGNIELDPHFTEDSYKLNWNSPCIEAGTPDTTGLGLPVYDLAGNPRIINNFIDMGSYEYDFPLETNDIVNDNIGNICIYPNPSSGNISVFYFGRKEEQLDLEISNTAGQAVYHKILPANSDGKIALHLENLSNGVYILYINDNSGRSSMKFMIRK